MTPEVLPRAADIETTPGKNADCDFATLIVKTTSNIVFADWANTGVVSA
jgi:hypothetical protein